MRPRGFGKLLTQRATSSTSSSDDGSRCPYGTLGAAVLLAGMPGPSRTRSENPERQFRDHVKPTYPRNANWLNPRLQEVLGGQDADAPVVALDVGRG